MPGHPGLVYWWGPAGQEEGEKWAGLGDAISLLISIMDVRNACVKLMDSSELV